jgi:hypothetical protein
VTHRDHVLAVAVALVVAGCTAAGTDDGAGNAATSAEVSHSPVAGQSVAPATTSPGSTEAPPASGQAAARPTPVPTPVETASPTPRLSAKERSDLFFHGIGLERFEPHPHSRYYDSLGEITSTRDVVLIALGRFVDIRFESYCFDDLEVGCYPQATMTVAIGEVFRGVPVSSVGGQVEVSGDLLERDADLDALALLLPEHETLLFLGAVNREPARYYPVNFQGILRDLGGRVGTIDPGESPHPAEYGSFPTELEGRPFDEILDRVRRLVTETPPVTRPD